ncbi:hypothetical protein NLM27_40550 [Bradyrhizobium sp. CCGB12]|uniref:hypothetical protein n=1 Tax=Bradyrhizobium sp. CCGB12 TaxID=2949632 RepID=UPI0020B19BC9|nr:hypothetical protein [Bradyrhizobium sp. CCGB12]MCP3395038.1 hypothetical protein [Bradyrhizobium sp. CCGB12]
MKSESASQSHQNAKRQRLEQQLAQLNREIERLVDAIAKGHGDQSVLGPRSTALGAERGRISEERSEPPVAKEVALHPAILKRYEEQLSRLEEALAKGVSGGDGEAAEAIRDLVETVTVFRDPGRLGYDRGDSGPAQRSSWGNGLSKPPPRSVGKDGSGRGTPYQIKKFASKFNNFRRFGDTCVLCR